MYLIFSFIFTFIGIFSLTFIIFLIQFFCSQLDKLTGKEISVLLIIKYIFYIGVSVIPLIFPISILFTSIITFGELSYNGELIVIKSSGISLFRILTPVISIIIIFSIGIYFFSDFIVPKAEKKAKEFGYQIISASSYLRKGIFTNIIPNLFIKTDKKLKNNTFCNIIIYFNDYENLTTSIIYSEKGKIISYRENKFLNIKLTNGYIYNYNIDSFNKKNIQYYRLIHFNSMIQNFKLPYFFYSKNKELYNEYDFISYQMKDLIKKIDFLKKEKTYNFLIYKIKFEIQKRITFPITCIIMFFIGSSLGSIIRKGDIGYPIIVALIIFIVYYILLIVTQNKVEKKEISPCIGAWIPNLVFLPFSVWITYKSTIDDYYYYY